MELVTEGELIVRRNCNYRDSRELSSMLEASKTGVQGSILDMMYKQVNSIRRIDFAEIDKSKGVVKDLPFHGKIQDAIKYLEKGGQCAKEDLQAVKTALTNISNMHKGFSDGYKLGVDVVVLTYETMVLAIVDGVSTLITVTGSSVVKTASSVSKVSIGVLKRFNTAVSNGSVGKMLTNALKTENEVKEEAGAVLAAAFVFGAAMCVVPLIRELVFYFYYTRMRITKYLEQIEMYIKINEVEVKNNPNFDSAKKKSIIEKQNKWISALDSICDKIRVDQSVGEKAAKSKMSESNKEFTVPNIKADMASKNEFQFD